LTWSHSFRIGLFAFIAMPLYLLGMSAAEALEFSKGSTVAEIPASGQPDSDLPPDSGGTDEDDDEALTLALVPARSPPALTCPLVDQVTLDWEAPGTASGWSENELSNSYSIGGIDLDFTVTGDTTNLASYGSLLTTNSPAEPGVARDVGFPSQSDMVAVTIDLGKPGIGVEAVQFELFDVDYGQWADRITISGTMNGIAATPVLSGSHAKSAPGNVATGTSDAENGTGDGNLSVTFLTPVDQIIFTFDNAPAMPDDPDFQRIAMQNITMCPRELADISAVKTVNVSNPGDYMIPGNEITYTITVTNSALARKPATDIVINDTLPDEVKFVSAMATGFTGGSFGNPALHAANTDCAGAACIIHFSGGVLDINSTGEIEMKVIIK